MNRPSAKGLSCALMLACLAASPGAQAALVNFESFADGDVLTNQVAGVSVSGGTILSAGVTLNDIDYPPRSGSNVLAALSDVLSLDFGTATSASAYFVTQGSVTAEAYDASNTLLQTLSSPFASTLGSPTFFDFSVAGATRYVLRAGGQYVIDDLSFTSAPAAVPEPASWAVTAAAMLALAASRRRTRG